MIEEHNTEEPTKAGRTLKEAAKNLSDYEKMVRKAWKDDPKLPVEPETYYTEPANVRKEEGGIKADSGKLRLDLLPIDALWAVAEVLTSGATEYGERNWEKGVNYSRVYAALLRHLMKWWNLQETDPDSGHCHVAHVATNALFLLHYALNEQAYVKNDNRPKASERKLV